MIRISEGRIFVLGGFAGVFIHGRFHEFNPPREHGEPLMIKDLASHWTDIGFLRKIGRCNPTGFLVLKFLQWQQMIRMRSEVSLFQLIQRLCSANDSAWGCVRCLHFPALLL